MKLSSSNELLAENKLLILYIIDKIGKPITDNELLKIIISVTDMNYFYFQQFLLDLLEIKYITKYEKDGICFYKLTENGKKVLDLTSNIIPGIMRLRVDTNIKSCKDSIADEISITAEFEPEDSNSFFVECKITEHNKTIFSIKVLAGSREQAKQICDNWKNNASELYPKLISILTKNKN